MLLQAAVGAYLHTDNEVTRREFIEVLKDLVEAEPH